MASITYRKPFTACILPLILYLCPELPSLFALPFTKTPFSASSAGRSLSCISQLKPLWLTRSSYSLHWDTAPLEQLFNEGHESCVLFLIPRLLHIHCLNLVYSSSVPVSSTLTWFPFQWEGLAFILSLAASLLTRGFPTGLLGSEHIINILLMSTYTSECFLNQRRHYTA